MIRTKLFAAVCMLACVPQTTRAQVLQLPVVSQFSIGTSVLVPDRGAVTLGSLSRSHYRSVHRGHPLRSLPYLGRVIGNQARTQATRLSEVQVTASIIDHGALDQAVLAEAARRNDSGSGQLSRDQVLAGQLVSRRAGVTAARRYRSSRAAARRPTKPTSTTVTAAEELQQLLTRASQSIRDGKPGAARIFYRMARKRTEDAVLQRLIDAQLNRLQ